MKAKLHILTVTLAFSLQPSGFLHAASPLGTAFTYQGRLNEGGQPANGSYDLGFAVFDAVSGPSQIGGVLTNAATPVSNGLFTVCLDFGPGVFTGEARWLEIGVRTNGSLADFATLTPRQPLTPSPYALYAPGAGTATTASAVAPGAVTGPGIATGQVVRSLNGLQDSVRLLPGTNVSVVSVGDSITVSATPGTVVTNAGWGLIGNSGTTAANFLGTLDGQALEFRVNGARALRIEPNTTSPNLICGNNINSVVAGVYGATIGGGGSRFAAHQVSANLGTIGGGAANAVSALAGSIGGGLANYIQANAENAWIGGGINNGIRTGATNSVIAGGNLNEVGIGSRHAVIGGGYAHNIGTNSSYDTIGGGYDNNIGDGAPYATVVGGIYNSIGENGYYSMVGGGRENKIAEDSWAATIAGGYLNDVRTNADYGAIGGGYNNNIGNTAAYATIAGGEYNDIGTNADYAAIGGGYDNNVGANAAYATIPGGRSNQATNYAFAAGNRAKANHTGAFVWADSSAADFASTTNDQFLVRATGGVQFSTDAAISSDSPKGISLSAQDRPLITRGWDPFSASAPDGKAGLGRWGLFMEPFNLVAGIPDADVDERAFAVWAYRTNGTHKPLFWVRNSDGYAWFSNNVSVATLTIRGGADLAEPFAISSADVPAGGLVVIDSAQPGRLRLSSQSYDRKVAGIVSGANGIQPGISMVQESALEAGRNVALSGRVYALVDASAAPVEPGDLLTTSDTPGHAMKVTDHARAQGAIVGKAMGRLAQGKGLVLVLVSLQ
jgi:hypothetical protein